MNSGTNGNWEREHERSKKNSMKALSRAKTMKLWRGGGEEKRRATGNYLIWLEGRPEISMESSVERSSPSPEFAV